MDRIEFEEWSLKGIDPALAPTPMERIRNGANGVEKQRKEILGHVSSKFKSLYFQGLYFDGFPLFPA